MSDETRFCHSMLFIGAITDLFLSFSGQRLIRFSLVGFDSFLSLYGLILCAY